MYWQPKFLQRGLGCFYYGYRYGATVIAYFTSIGLIIQSLYVKSASNPSHYSLNAAFFAFMITLFAIIIFTIIIFSIDYLANQIKNTIFAAKQ